MVINFQHDCMSDMAWDAFRIPIIIAVFFIMIVAVLGGNPDGLINALPSIVKGALVLGLIVGVAAMIFNWE